MRHSLLSCPVVEEVAWFNVSVNDAVRVDIPQSKQQSSHVPPCLRHCHVRKVILGSGGEGGNGLLDFTSETLYSVLVPSPPEATTLLGSHDEL